MIENENINNIKLYNSKTKKNNDINQINGNLKKKKFIKKLN